MEDQFVHFIWRNLCASYDLTKKEFTFYSYELSIVPWGSYPEDMYKFITWIQECSEHKADIKWKDYETGELVLRELKSVEIL